MTDLAHLIVQVDAEVAAAGDRQGMDYRQSGEAGRAVAERLKTSGARFGSSTGSDHIMTMGGVRSTCTSGWFGLFSNWQNAARRRMAQQEGK